MAAFCCSFFVDAEAQGQYQSSLKYDLSSIDEFESVTIYGPNEQYFHSTNSVDSTTFLLDEPERAMMFINESRREIIYLHEGLLEIGSHQNELTYSTSLNKEMQQLMRLRTSVNGVADTFLNRFRNNNTFSRDSIMEIFHSVEELYLLNDYYLSYSNPKSFLNIQLAKFLIKSNNESLDIYALFENMDPVLHQYPSYEKIKWALDSRADVVPYEVGQQVSGDTLTDQWGHRFSVNDLLVPGKMLYIDFWTSECGGTSIYRKQIQELQTQFHDKVKFISVCSSQNWEQIISMNDELDINWENYNCQEGELNPIFKKYSILNSISGYLLNDRGEIIIANLHPARLEQSLLRILED